jgi:hypothetical protein
MPILDATAHASIAEATATQAMQEVLHRGDQTAWSTTALVLALQGRGSAEVQATAADLLRALGLDLAQVPNHLDRQRRAAQAAAPLLLTAAVLNGDVESWADQPDEALIAQGRASAQGAEAFRRFGLPQLPGLADALMIPGARMLDVGTGVAALAVAYAELFPVLTVVGLDVLPRVLALAAKTVADSAVAERVLLRKQDVSTLAEQETFTLAWLPAPFIPETALRTGTHRVTQALIPGGWLMLGHGRFFTDPVDNALNRFKTAVFGGTAIDDAQAQALLHEAGLTAVTTIPTPPGSPAITVGQKTVA